MGDFRTQPASAPAGNHLVLYDGVCGLCNRLTQFLLTHDVRGVFDFGSLQSAVGQEMVTKSGGNPADLNSFYVFADYRTDAARVFTRSDAAIFVASELGWPWKVMCVARVLPKAFRDRVYNLVARVRYRVFGRYDRCVIPRPEFRSRFVD